MVARRLLRTVVVERPRQKGWWGEPEAEEIEPEYDVREAALRDQPRKQAEHQERPITPVGRALSSGQIDAIRAIMRTFVDDDTARGVDPRSSLHCHRCGSERPAIGSVRYDRYTFCHECSIDYEIQVARGLLDSPAEFTDRFVQPIAAP